MKWVTEEDNVPEETDTAKGIFDAVVLVVWIFGLFYLFKDGCHDRESDPWDR